MSELVSLITGITGQDGSYLAELLLSKNYIVYGLVRKASTINTSRIDHILDNPNLLLRYGDLGDSGNLCAILLEIKNKHPNMKKFEVYNLGAMSHVKVSFEIPEHTGNIDGIGTTRLLDAIRSVDLHNIVRFYQASSSEMFGKVQEIPQTELTPFYPRSPYGVAKLYSYWITKNYREAYNMFACNGILFNHESERRNRTFVTRKITQGLADIISKKTDRLVLGNLDSKRDWGYAKDYVYGMWLMLQHDKPDDYILATGKEYSVRQFVEKAFSLRGYKICWKGSGVNEVGYDLLTGKELIFVDEKYFRPTEVDELLGCSDKARSVLGWKTDTSFSDLVQIMVDSDCPNVSTQVTQTHETPVHYGRANSPPIILNGEYAPEKSF